MQRSRIAIFLALAFVPAWLLAFVFFARGGQLNSVSFVAIGVVYMFTPAIAAIITHIFIGKGRIAELGVRSPRWKIMLVAWLAPVALVLVAMAISLTLPHVSLAANADGILASVSDKLTPEQLTHLRAKLSRGPLGISGVLPLLALLQVLIAGPTINAVAAFGEELGWRGFLLREFRSLGFWPASWIIGVIWGLWHLPLIARGYNYPGHPIGGPAMMTLLTVLLTPLISYLRLRARSVFAAAVFHGTFNAAATLTIFLHGGTAMTTGVLGACGMITLALANVALWFYLRRNPEPFTLLEPATAR